MSAPFFEYGVFGPGTGLLIALLIGIGFGFFLEQGGMGNAVKLAGQFYLTDLTVFKIMFTAVVTASIGLYWLGRAGLVNLALVYTPPTWIVPQLLGGILFGEAFPLFRPFFESTPRGTWTLPELFGISRGLAVFVLTLVAVAAFLVADRIERPGHRGDARGSATVPGPGG